MWILGITSEQILTLILGNRTGGSLILENNRPTMAIDLVAEPALVETEVVGLGTVAHISAAMLVRNVDLRMTGPSAKRHLAGSSLRRVSCSVATA